MSASTPSTGPSTTRPRSRKFARTAVKRSPAPTRRCEAAASAAGSWSRPVTQAPASRRLEVCPPKPRVQSTQRSPGRTAARASTSARSTGLCTPSTANMTHGSPPPERPNRRRRGHIQSLKSIASNFAIP
jgi:hypothetical protein